MKKIYIQPTTELTAMITEGVVAASVGLSDGDGLGNQLPEGNTDNNFFTQHQEFWEE